MAKSLDTALAEVAKLPIATQNKIGRDLLKHVAQLQDLRREIIWAFDRSIPELGEASISRM